MLTNDQIDAPEDRPQTVAGGPRLPDGLGSPAVRRRPIALALGAVILALCFIRPLYDLARFALASSLYSHILLIPFISLYLIWPKRRALPVAATVQPGWAILPLLGALALLAGYFGSVHSDWKPQPADYLACMTLAFLLLLLSGSLLVLGPAALRAIAFPAAFLIFMVPFPAALLGWIESFLQHGSAEAAYVLLTWSGMPVLRHGTEFQLPGFSMAVAPECSGIHSTIVLFITSLVAGHVLLRRTWTRAFLAAAVIPLAILRNGFRIFTLGQLCVNVDSDWINSPLHHRGGPLFFVLSLVPFFLLLLFLRKWESRTDKSIITHPKS
jgi:exosortase C (VPDSG-CTERM-specific)